MRRSARLLVVLAATLMLTTSAGAGSAYAAKTVVGPGDSIQAAVDAAKPGDTVRIAPGTRKVPLIAFQQ